MTFNKKTITIISALSLASVVTLAISANQDIELSQYLNGRGGPNFRSTARNINAVLATGTRAHIDRVKNLSSGNSGLYVTINSGPQNGKHMWIYFNKSSPGMKLVNADGTVTEIPGEGGRATTTRPIVATPGGPPAPSSAPAPAPPVPAPPVAAPTPAPLPVPGPAVSATIGAGLGAVSGLNGGTGMQPPCTQDCAGAGSGGATSPAPNPMPVVIPPAPLPVPNSGAAVEDVNNPGLLFFSTFDSLIRPPAGASAAVITAHKYMVLKMNIEHAARICDLYNYSSHPVFTAPNAQGVPTVTRGSTMSQAQRDQQNSDVNSLGNRWRAQVNRIQSFVTETQTAFGGQRAATSGSVLTSYTNLAGTYPSDLAMRNRDISTYCPGILPEFTVLTSLSLPDFRAYVNMSDAQRLAYLKAHVR